jgi:hypothetical protein
MLSRDQFLRVTELEILREDVGIAHPTEAWQTGPDLGRDRIVTVAVPAQEQLGLLSEVFEIRSCEIWLSNVWHGRSYG